MIAFLRRYISPFSFIVLLVFWHLLDYFSLLPKFVLPGPWAILQAAYRDRMILLSAGWYTMNEALIGLFLGIAAAFVLAVLMDSFSWLADLVYPFLIITQTIPTVAMAPVLVLWFGYGMSPKIILIVLTTLFPIVISLLDGFRHCDADAIRLLQLMQATRIQVMYHVKFPTALPYFFAGLRVSVSYAFIAAVVSEWLGGFDGLGVYMLRVKKAFSYDSMFAVIILISVISILSMRFIKILEKRIIKWKYL